MKHAHIASALLLIPAIALSARADESFVLENGLKVILAPRPAAPVVTAQVLVKAGSSEEAGPSEYGLAHLNEHMAFKTTAKRTVGEIAAVVEKNGGSYNAYTSRDETVYYINLPADRTPLALDLLADMVFHPAYDPEEFASEKEVVVEEIRRRNDNPNITIHDRFSEIAYPGHPYGRPVIGSIETVRGVSIEEAEAFHDAYYRPDNAVLVIVGGFDAEKTKADIRECFGAVPVPETPLVRPALPTPPEIAGPKVVVGTSAMAATAKAYIGFKGFPAGDPRSVRADLLAAVLSTGRASRLEESVKNRQGLVSSISAYVDSGRDVGLFIIAFDAEAAKVPAAVKAVLAELENIFREPFGTEELEKARALEKLGLLKQREYVENMGRLLAAFEYNYGDWRLLDSYLPQWDQTTSADLVQIAADLFKPEAMSLAVLLPENAADIADELDAVTAFFAPKPKLDGAAAAPEFEKVDFLPGIELWVMQDPRRDLVSVNAGVVGGLFAEDAAKTGIGNFMAEVWPRATVGRPSTELALAGERIGAWLSALSGQNSMRLGGSFMRDNWQEGLSLFLEVLTKPAFDAVNVEETRQEILAAIARRDERPASRAFEMANRALYRGHPYGMEALGTRESIMAITADDLADHYRRYMHPGSLVIAVAGNVDPATVRDALAEALRDWRATSGDVASPAHPPAALAAEEFTRDARDLSQTQIVFGFQGPGLGGDDAAALEVLLGHLSGTGGPLYMELREKQSLAYSVGGGFRPGLGAGDIKFYIGTDPQKAATAFAGMRKILEKTVREGVKREDVDDAKSYIIGQYKFARQSLESLTSETLSNVLYGLGPVFNDRHLAAIASVTEADVRRVAERYIDFDKAVFAVVGTEESLEAIGNALSEK
ncbi:MAG: insulinase family protein [Planctomycetota bacterium]|jgi:zinc protease|nr:insulinase family protein [Planctomycetota bacterium]